jgi:23S rRNA pseudouridine2604 synthase
MGIRINKYLSEAGVCSRREADRLLGQGRILIDGERAVMGQQVEDGQRVTVDGKEVHKEESEIYLAFYKPKGIVCTTAEQENGEKIVNVVDYIQYPKRVYPVGRLDQNSEGLLLLTNQGDVMEKILRSRYGHEKEYYVRVNQKITDAFLRQMASGVPILDTVTKPCKVWKEDEKSFHIVLTQGLNRQIRRMCEALGYRVVLLRRDRVVNITLQGLVKGRYRELTGAEVSELKRTLGIR